jgi:hypothetical protein
MNEIDQGNVCLIEWMTLGSLGSMGPLLRPINRHNHHSKAILGVPKRRRFIPRHRGGPAASRGSAARPNCHAGWNRSKAPTLNHLKSSDQGHPSREAVNHRAGAPPHLAAPVKMVPHAQRTSLTYKRSLTLTGTGTQRWSISFSHSCSLRVGLV